MKTSLFDFLSASNIVAYWIEKNVNTQPYLGETLFPNKKEIGINIEWIKGAYDQPIELKLSAYDSKSTRRNRPGLEKFITEMPFFKESMYVDEKMRQQLNTLMQTNNQALINQILSKIFDDQITLINAARISLERMRMEVLTTGKLELESNGQKYSYDYGLEENQIKTVTTDWGNPTTDIINDLIEFKELMKSKGVTITRGVCNSSVAKDIRKNEGIKNSIYVLAGGSIKSISTERALQYIYDETGIEIYVYDNVYVNDENKAVKYIADDTLVLLPDGVLGATHLGTTPEESDLISSNYANVAIVDTGIAVTTYGTTDPVNVEEKVSMVGLPSFERANEIMIIDTNGV
jgi:hypothetical protein